MVRKNGFTLIELLVVVAIIAILSAVALVSYTSVTMRSRDSKRMVDVQAIQSALEMYRSDNDAYPTSALFNNATLGQYFTDRRLPTDPRPGGSCAYTYVSPAPPNLYSLTYCREVQDDTQTVFNP